jgi:hypothetical protein
MHLDFLCALLFTGRQRRLELIESTRDASVDRRVINERSTQPTHHDPPQMREVKPVLSRSCPPLLWISAGSANDFRRLASRAMSTRQGNFFLIPSTLISTQQSRLDAPMRRNRLLPALRDAPKAAKIAVAPVHHCPAIVDLPAPAARHAARIARADVEKFD